jgi:hypothetical protein
MCAVKAKNLISKSGLPGDQWQLYIEFFVVFSRFEYALKRDGHVHENGNINWDQAANKFEAAYSEAAKEFSTRASYLHGHPPQKMILTTAGVAWRALDTSTISETRRALLFLGTIRNNLFHGGKWPDGPKYGVERDHRLVEDALKIITFFLSTDSNLRNIFEEFP